MHTVLQYKSYMHRTTTRAGWIISLDILHGHDSFMLGGWKECAEMEIESARHCEYDNDTITVLAMLAMIRCV